MSKRRSTRVPRVVVVTRPTEYEELIARHATRAQASFFLAGRGKSLEAVDAAHKLAGAALQSVSAAIPGSWRRSAVTRGDLNRFVFEPGDLIVAVGQDGLVANVAKYLRGQKVIGVNPDPSHNTGVLVPHRPGALKRLFRAAQDERLEIESRCMALVRVDDGQEMLALNEVFLGHQSHQSARYEIAWKSQRESQSSSGLIVSTGTGATGWAQSICLRRQQPPELPAPCDPRLAFFVRESFPSVGTGTSLQDGLIDEQGVLRIVSHMNEGGVIFGDGIEDDRIPFYWGMTAEIRVADLQLHLVR